MGFLTENHRCPGGVWARVGKALLTVLLGGLIGMLAVYLANDRPDGPVTALVLAAAALGAVLAMAIRQAVGGRP
jgi:uncharacterized membrane protein YeaQ/YmgE (transglycosylase-associated protein family)